MNIALRRAADVAKHDHLVILITDYDGDDESNTPMGDAIGRAQRCVGRPGLRSNGRTIPGRGPMEATDGRGRMTIPDDARFAKRFEAQFRNRCDQIRERLRAIRIPILPICTHEPVTDQVVAALGGQR